MLDLLDWKRRIFSLYDEVRHAQPDAGWQRWRDVRDELFGSHPQTPLGEDALREFRGLEYFPYDARLRVEAEVVGTDSEAVLIRASGGERIAFERFGRASFDLLGETHELDLYWLPAYGGGVFLPFADETSGSETYAGGRYLLDTVKGADLGGRADRLLLDFNFSYNPSCAYDPRWICPLTPQANRLPVAVRAGERRPPLTPFVD